MEKSLIWADVPDPSVIRAGEFFYMTSTTMYFTPGCPVMKSRDLVHWEIVGYVYDVLGDGDCFTLKNGRHDYGRGSWASCLREHDGTFYVTFAAYNANKTYVFTTGDIEKGPWKRHEIDGVYHDMSLLFDEGRVFMVYGGGEIKLIELTADATAIKPGGLHKTIIKNADPTGGDGLAEGAHIYRIGGFYYIFIIAWPKTGTRRRIQVCYRSEKIDGEYECRVIFDDDMGFRNAGVAQGGIVQTQAGEWFAFLFQDHGAVGRVPVLVPLRWEYGWPVLGEARLVSAEGLLISDDFDGHILAPQWQWNHNPVNTHWSLLKGPCRLRLETSHIAGGLTNARNTLTQRTFGPRCSGRVKIDVSRMLDGDFAGLAALQELYGFVGVKMERGKKYVVMAAAPWSENTYRPGVYETGTPAPELEAVPLLQDVLYLRVDFNFFERDKKVGNSDFLISAGHDAALPTETAGFFYSLDGSQWTTIGSPLKMEYRLSHFTGYRFALFNFATRSAGGYVDFEWFKLI